jgi:NADH-quinone oxidoreductase subunit J
MLVNLLFIVFSTVLLGAAIGVITSRNPVFSALWLVLCFVNSAVLWLLVEAEFLAIVLVLVYVGAVMVLFLFVVMMLDVNVAALREGFTRFAPLGVAVGALVALELGSVIWLRQSGIPVAEQPVSHGPLDSNTREIGMVLYTRHAYAFELSAFLLLLAIVAAILLTHRSRPGLKVQDIGKQVAVRRQDRVRLVQMPPEIDP